MEKKCFSLKTPDFEKCLKALGKGKEEKLLAKIKELEAMENDRSLVPQGKISGELTFGKRLSNLNRNTYVLEIGFDRAMAVVKEVDGKKAFIWCWTGSHEEYNKKLKAQALNKNENSVVSSQAENITKGVQEIKSVKVNVEGMRDKYHKPHNKKAYQHN